MLVPHGHSKGDCCEDGEKELDEEKLHLVRQMY